MPPPVKFQCRGFAERHRRDLDTVLRDRDEAIALGAEERPTLGSEHVARGKEDGHERTLGPFRRREHARRSF